MRIEARTRVTSWTIHPYEGSSWNLEETKPGTWCLYGRVDGHEIKHRLVYTPPATRGLPKLDNNAVVGVMCLFHSFDSRVPRP